MLLAPVRVFFDIFRNISKRTVEEVKVEGSATKGGHGSSIDEICIVKCVRDEVYNKQFWMKVLIILKTFLFLETEHARKTILQIVARLQNTQEGRRKSILSEDLTGL